LAKLETLVNTEPLFVRQGAWSAGFLKAKGDGPGVVVGPGGANANVFAQGFNAAPGEPFRVVARAASVGSARAVGRLQINWQDASGKFLSVSTKMTDLGERETVLELSAVAPAGTVTGTLYVVAGGETVVRYTEMSLYGVAARTPQGSASPQTNGPGSWPRPQNLTPLDNTGKALSVEETQYYFYQAAHAMQRKARERGMDYILYIMPDNNISRLMPVIQRLREEGIKVLAYAPQGEWSGGVDMDWYWQRADSHWTPAAVRLTADEILQMWQQGNVENRPFSRDLMRTYGEGFPSEGAAR
jgi:hypothetical protein